MMRRVLASLAMLTLAVGLGVRADDSAKKPDDVTSIQEDVRAKQLALENRFHQLTVQLRTVAERMARSTKKEDREKAQHIQDALKLANEAGIGSKFKTLIEQLQKNKVPKIDDIDNALDESNQLISSLEAMLQLLMSEGKDKERAEEIKRLEALLKELNKVIRDQKIVRAKTEKGTMDPNDLKNAQAKVTDSTRDLANATGGDPKSGKDPKAGEKATPKENKDPKGGEGTKKENKGGEGKEGTGKENKGGEGKESSSKPKDAKDGAGEKKPEGKDGSKDGKDKAGDKKENKDGKGGEGSPKDAKDGKDSKGDASGKPKDAKDSKSSDGNAKGKPSDSPPSPGSGKPSDGGDGGKTPPPPPSKPKPPPLPGRKNIEEAIKNQEKAIEKLPKPNASDDQDDAIKELEKARAELEKLLKQKREEEMDALLAQLEARCKYMLQLQKEVYEATLQIDKAVGNNPDKQPTKLEHSKSQTQSEKEGEIVKEAKRAIGLLEADNTAVVFTEVFRQLKEDMELVQNRLGKTDVGPFTQSTEEDIIRTLEDMIKALEKARKDNQQPPPPPGPPGTPPPPGPKDLLDKLAELKLVKSRQIIVNNRTEKYGKLYPGEQAETKDIQDELKKLGKDQSKLHKMIVDMATEKNK